MDTGNIIFIVIFAFLILMLVVMVVSGKKNKKEVAKREAKNTLTNTLRQTKQHLKYKKSVTIITLISFIYYILLSLSLILFVLLPIYQIKIELLGVTIYTKSFSFCEALKEFKDENGISLGVFITWTLIFVYTVGILLGIFYDVLKRTINSGERTTRTFADEKVDHRNHLIIEPATPILFIAIYIIAIVYAKNAEDNIDPTYFGLCNGVSGLIALPIICFVISFVLSITNAILQNNLQKEILKEEIINA